MPHAVRELAELGLLDELTSIGIPTAEFVLFNKHGKRIWGELRGYAAGYRWPQISIHRGELLGILYRAVLSRLGPERVRTGHHLTRFGQTEDQVWAELATGQAEQRSITSRLICLLAAMASIQRSGGRSTQTKALHSGTASSFGARSRKARHFSPVAPC